MAPFGSGIKEVRLLAGGPQEIAIYGDGSFRWEALAGAWAAFVPALGLQFTGVGRGSSIEEFELMALVEGVRAMLAIDYTSRPLHLYTDSDTALAAVRHLGTRSGLPAQKSLDRIRELYACAGSLIGKRSLRASKARTDSPFHRLCHRAANKAMQGHVRDLLATDFEVKLRYEECRRKQWAVELERLHRRAKLVEAELEECNDRIAQLRSCQLPPVA